MEPAALEPEGEAHEVCVVLPPEVVEVALLGMTPLELEDAELEVEVDAAVLTVELEVLPAPLEADADELVLPAAWPHPRAQSEASPKSTSPV